MSASQFTHGVENLHTLACPRSIALLAQIGSSLPWYLLCNITITTIVFSSLTAKLLMAVKTSSSAFSVCVPPALLLKSFKVDHHSNQGVYYYISASQLCCLDVVTPPRFEVLSIFC